MNGQELDEIEAHLNELDLPCWQPKVQNKPQCMAYELAMSGTVMQLGYGGQAYGGKALPLSTTIPTPTGYKLMGELDIGNDVFGSDGNIYQIVGVSDVMHGHRVFDITFDDETVVRADGGHKWHTFSYRERLASYTQTPEYRAKRRQNRKPRGIGKRPDLARRNREQSTIYASAPVAGMVRTTTEIMDTLMDGNRANHAVQMASLLQLPCANLLVEPYMLGCWLGDGNCHHGRITVGNEDIEDTKRIVSECGYELRKIPSCKLDYTVLGLQPLLREIGVLKNKHIPNKYLFTSFEQRLSLLQGLMDTDGHAYRSGQCEFYNSSKALIKDVSRLLSTLGIKHNIRSKKPPIGTDYNFSYRIKFAAPFPVFRLKRKAARQNLKLRKRQGWRYIIDVAEVNSEPVKCIAVNSPDSLYLVGEECVPTHNTDLIMGLAGTVFNKSLIMRRTFPQLSDIVIRGDEIYPARYIAGDKKRWSFDGKTIFLGNFQYEGDWQNYQGKSFSLMAFDEAAQFTEFQVRAVGGWQRSAKGEKTLTLFCFNPPTTPEGEWIVQMFAPWVDPNYKGIPAEDGEIRWFVRINDKEVEVESGDIFEHDDETLYPVSRTFITATRYDNPYLTEEYERMLGNMPEPLRSAMMHGDFTLAANDDRWQVIPTNWILAAQERWRNGVRPDVALRSVGVDVAHGGKDSTTIAKLYGTWFDEIDAYPGTQTPDGQTAAHFVIQAMGGQQAPIYVDGIGYGASCCDILKAMTNVNAHAVNNGAGSKATDRTGIYQFTNIRDESYWKLREALDPQSGENIALPDDRDLRVELSAMRYKIVGGKIKVEPKEDIIKRLGRSPDRADAIALAWHGCQVQSLRYDFM